MHTSCTSGARAFKQSRPAVAARLLVPAGCGKTTEAEAVPALPTHHHVPLHAQPAVVQLDRLDPSRDQQRRPRALIRNVAATQCREACGVFAVREESAAHRWRRRGSLAAQPRQLAHRGTSSSRQGERRSSPCAGSTIDAPVLKGHQRCQRVQVLQDAPDARLPPGRTVLHANSGVHGLGPLHCQQSGPAMLSQRGGAALGRLPSQPNHPQEGQSDPADFTREILTLPVLPPTCSRRCSSVEKG